MPNLHLSTGQNRVERDDGQRSPAPLPLIVQEVVSPEDLEELPRLADSSGDDESMIQKSIRPLRRSERLKHRWADEDQVIEGPSTITNTLATEKNTTYIMGDFNLDLLKSHTDNKIQYFLDIIHTHSFINHIDQPTRFTSSTNTLIDNIFSNSLVSSTTAGCFYTDINDHLPTFLLSHRTNSTQPSRVVVT
ncbi:hypothetical protein CAPTEDRAFT_209499, partial [Capitella teleta]